MKDLDNLIRLLNIRILNLEGYAHSEFIAGMEEVLEILKDKK